MPKKPEETAKKPTHGPKPEKLPHQKEKGQKPGEATKPTPVITHKHERKEKVERDCTKCAHAVQVSDTEWECIKEHYFPNTLICFVPRDEEVAAT